MEENKTTILVIDDEETILKFLGIHLEKEGFEVIKSSGGKQVFKTLDKLSYGIVICDIRMPEVDGVKVLEHIKKQSDAVPVIMLTGLMDVDVAVEVMRKGAFDYILKPIKKERLMNTIQRALNHRELLEKNRKLEHENMEYQMFLEKKVSESTWQLREAYNKLKAQNTQFVSTLAETIEAKDKFTHGHCARVRNLCIKLGSLAGMSRRQLEVLEYASVLHDLGKIGTQETVLNKPGPLTDDETKHMRKHAALGEKILIDIPVLSPVAKVIGAHHERYNGEGYPRGLEGSQIPSAARVITVVDSFDAMNNDRPYRKGMPLEQTLGELDRSAGIQFDPVLVKLFMKHKLYLVDGDE